MLYPYSDTPAARDNLPPTTLSEAERARYRELAQHMLEDIRDQIAQLEA